MKERGCNPERASIGHNIHCLLSNKLDELSIEMSHNTIITYSSDSSVCLIPKQVLYLSFFIDLISIKNLLKSQINQPDSYLLQY